MTTELLTPTIKRSPWGVVQHQTNYAPGVDFVSTAGHGGFKLDRKTNALIPKVFRRPGGWYEEDCEYAIVVWFLYCDPFLSQKEAAQQTVKNWFWKEWEAHTGTVLAPGESRMKDEHTFRAANRDRFIVTSARRQDAATVAVTARRESDGAEGRFLVPDGEYTHRGFGFVIDEARHPRA